MRFLNEILDRPSNETPFLLLVAGYPEDDVKVPEIAKKPFEEVSSWFTGADGAGPPHQASPARSSEARGSSLGSTDRRDRA
jgi:hypothetical protein